MLEFFWVCDYVCYPITDLDRTRGLRVAEAPIFPRQLVDEFVKVVSPTHTFALFPG